MTRGESESGRSGYMKWVAVMAMIAVFGNPAFGFSFESAGVKYSVPKKVVIKVGGDTLFSSSKPKTWDEETDLAYRLRFESHDFLIVGTWDSADFTTFRLFHLGKSSGDIKQYRFMSAVEDDDRGEFFVADGKLHYWESKFCGKKTVMVFNPTSLEFKVEQLQNVSPGGCLPAQLQTAKGKNKLEWEKLSLHP